MNKILSVGLSAVAAVAFGFATQTASANSITLTGGVGVASVGGGSDWTYTYTFANSELQNGDFFTINDFGPATPVDAPNDPSASWTLTQALTGLNALPATDDPSVLNVTFTWNDSTVIPGILTDTFTLHSPSGIIPQMHQYTSRDHAADSEGESDVIGPVFGPRTVPDGGSGIALLGMALVGVEGLRRKLNA